jgi:hypothetical protein
MVREKRGGSVKSVQDQTVGKLIETKAMERAKA